MLVDATRRDISIELFGRKYATPLLAAPVGVQGLMHKDAEEATARACRGLGIPFCMSTAATRTIEQVAEASGEGTERWFQLYWPRPMDEDITLSLLDRAKRSGFSTLIVTLDTFHLGWRPTDLDPSFLPFMWGQGCQVGHSDPVFNRKYQEAQAADSRTAAEKISEAYDMLRRPGTLYGALRILRNVSTLKKSLAWIEVMHSGTYRTWNDLEILKKNWTHGPIVLKGIQTVADAHLAIDHGMNGIIVSNHGGRQVDGAIASIDALAEIAADSKVQSSGIELLFDSGIRTGSDILKALALGANAVLVGRPYMYGLAIGGQEGVHHVFKPMLADMDIALACMGKKSIKELSRDDLEIVERRITAKL